MKCRPTEKIPIANALSTWVTVRKLKIYIIIHKASGGPGREYARLYD